MTHIKRANPFDNIIFEDMSMLYQKLHKNGIIAFKTGITALFPKQVGCISKKLSDSSFPI